MTTTTSEVCASGEEMGPSDFTASLLRPNGPAEEVDPESEIRITNPSETPLELVPVSISGFTSIAIGLK